MVRWPVALVTGGGPGIGLSIVERSLDAVAQVAALDRDEERVGKLNALSIRPPRKGTFGA